MGLSNKVIFKGDMFKIKEFEVRTRIGMFKYILFKEKCAKSFRIRANQISVIHNGGENYIRENTLSEVVFREYSPIESIFDDNNPKITTKTYKLNNFNSVFELSTYKNVKMKNMIEKFTCDLNYKII